ncbi:response regulator [Rhizobium sp. LjRoot254]|uniref:response regulator n=1 Tax=Rhizobium sp. LjRoot254 TaxID=3342297 RepID=UPI003ED164D1
MADQRGRIAVIDDDLGIRRSLERLLTLNGFEVTLYESPEIFINQSHTNVFNCLVLDVHFDGMSGLELRELLLRSGAKSPVVLMSAADENQIPGLPPDCKFLHKPFSGSVLITAIREAVSSVPGL